MGTLPSLSFGALLRQFRLAASLTQEELAEYAHLSVEAISTLERGTRRAPRHKTLLLLSVALGLSDTERALLQNAAQQSSNATGKKPYQDPSSQLHSPFAWPLVGRIYELRLLERHLAEDRPPLFLLAGEPGIGKTRLLRETADRARREGWSVLEGGCHRRSGQEPYAPLPGALARHLEHLSQKDRQAAIEHSAWLTRLLPELTEMVTIPLASQILPSGQERRLMFAAVGRYLRNVAGPSGTLLVLDDLQWAGVDAMDMLTTLVRTTRGAGLRVLGAYRSTEVSPSDPLGILLADLAATGLATLHTLGPLALQEAGALLESLLPKKTDEDNALHEQLLARTGGVPFFLVSCARAVQAGILEGQSPQKVPWDVGESIRQRMAVLPQQAQDLLGVAAVVGRRVERAVLVDVLARLGLHQEEMLRAVEVVNQARLLLERGEATYMFPHDLIREVIVANLSATRRAMLHQRVADALEQVSSSPPLERLAYHYERAGNVEKAVVHLERVGDRAWDMHAHAEAQDAYQKVIEWLERLGSREEGARVRQKLCKALSILARYDQALDVLEEAVARYRAVGNLEGYWQSLAQFGRVHALRGSHEEGLARLWPLREPLEKTTGSPALADFHLALAELSFGTYQYQEQLALATNVVEVAQSMSDHALLARAMYWQSLALFRLGRLEEGKQIAEEVVALAEKVGDLWASARALNSIASAFGAGGKFDRSKASVEQALEVARRIGDPAMIAFLLSNRADWAFMSGEWGEARGDYEQAVALVRQMSGVWGGVYSLLGLGRLCLAEGQWLAATQYLEEGIAVAEWRGNLEALRVAQIALAERDLLNARPEVARSRLEPLYDRTAQQERGAFYLLPLLAWAYKDLGKETLAEALVRQVLAWAQAEQNRLVLVDALRVQGSLAQGQRRWEEARQSLEEALKLCRAMPYPYAEAKALYFFGLLHQAMGDSAQAHERLEAGLAILNQLGERLYAEVVERALITV